MKIVKLCLKVRNDKRPTVIVNNSQKLFDVFNSYFDKGTIHIQESVWVCYMNTAKEVIAVQNLANGGMSSCIIDTKLIIATALNLGCSCLAIAHNHPSGANRFSQSDIDTTEKISMACSIMDMSIIDHILMFGNEYKSMADCGELNTYSSNRIINEIKSCQ